MVWVIAIIAVLGNLYLLGGYDVEGDLAVFVVGVALAADAYLIYRIFKTIFSRNKATATAAPAPAAPTTLGIPVTHPAQDPHPSTLQYPAESKKTPTSQPVKDVSIKCPVCKTELPSNAAKCSCCGFNELHREFISAEDAATWFEETVVPHRLQWEQTKNQPAFHTADELYAQMAALQSKGISSHINEKASDFNINDYRDGVEVIRYNGNSSHVVIPNEINGKPVLRLGNSLFENCKWLTEVTLPNRLISIGNKAFRSSTLTHIVFPASLTDIGEEAFAHAAITEMVFPPSVKIIPKQVCYTCNKLKTVIIMGAVEIGEYAFGFSDAITKLALPETLHVIKKGAFASCHGISDIVLPASLRSIYGDFNCSLRGSIVVLNDNLEWLPAAKPTAHGLLEKITIYCNPGSTSQKHALEWGMKMKYLSEYQR